jgi:hypothetical protein
VKTTVSELSWARISDAQRFVPASRSTYYNWFDEGLVRSRCIKGARYVDMESLRQFIEGAPSKPSKKVSRRMLKRAHASAAARQADD